MAYSTAFTSFSAIKRRMAQSSESVSPGFVAMISSIDTSKKTVDCLVQNSGYYLRGVKYATTFEDKPPYIKVRSVVYIRRSSGNKMTLEVEGPAHVIPTITALADQLPPLPVERDVILSGLELKPSVFNTMTVAITTGTVRISGVVYTMSVAKVGENQNSKVTVGGSSTLPGVPKVGNLFLVGGSYTFLKVDAASAVGSGLYRQDQVEIGTDRIIDYRVGTPSSNPQLQSVQAGHLLIGTILVRPGATAIYFSDINARLNTSGFILAPVSWTMAVPNQVTFGLSMRNQDGTAIVGASISLTFLDVNNNPVGSPSAVYGTLTPFPATITDPTGTANFVYDNTGATKSARIVMTYAVNSSSATLAVHNTVSGSPLPF